MCESHWGLKWGGLDWVGCGRPPTHPKARWLQLGSAATGGALWNSPNVSKPPSAGMGWIGVVSANHPPTPRPGCCNWGLLSPKAQVGQADQWLRATWLIHESIKIDPALIMVRVLIRSVTYVVCPSPCSEALVMHAYASKTYGEFRKDTNLPWIWRQKLTWFWLSVIIMNVKLDNK